MTTPSTEEIARISAKTMWAEDNATRALGIEMISVGPGRATMAMTIQPGMTNGHGMCHGGYLFLLVFHGLSISPSKLVGPAVPYAALPSAQRSDFCASLMP